MFGFATTTTRKHRVHLITLCAVLLAGSLIAAPALARPANLDRSLDRTSDHGVFRVQLQSARSPIPLWRVHQWTVHLTDAAGQPVSGAVLVVDGGMPDHHHGLPTAPRATPGAAAGDYVISGMKVSMPGWWVLTLAVKGLEGQADTITFNVVL